MMMLVVMKTFMVRCCFLHKSWQRRSHWLTSIFVMIVLDFVLAFPLFLVRGVGVVGLAFKDVMLFGHKEIVFVLRKEKYWRRKRSFCGQWWLWWHEGCCSIVFRYLFFGKTFNSSHDMLCKDTHVVVERKLMTREYVRPWVTVLGHYCRTTGLDTLAEWSTRRDRLVEAPVLSTNKTDVISCHYRSLQEKTFSELMESFFDFCRLFCRLFSCASLFFLVSDIVTDMVFVVKESHNMSQVTRKRKVTVKSKWM